MSKQFPQAARNLLLAIDCPCCMGDHTHLVAEMFLDAFARHVTKQFFEDVHVNEVTAKLDDMQKEQQP